MLSNTVVRLLTVFRPTHNYQHHLLRLLSTAESSSTQNMSNNRETGVVKRFSKEKGYGFISKNSDGTDCFVQYVDFDFVEFDLLFVFILKF